MGKSVLATPEVSIIIPTCNRSELIEFTLLSLYEQTASHSTYEIIVVDDGSGDETPTLLSKLRPPYRFHLLVNEANRGAAYTRNRGIKAARGDLLIFLDEMLVDADYVERHLRYHEAYRRTAVTTTFNFQTITTHRYLIGSASYPSMELVQSMRYGLKPVPKSDGTYALRLFPPEMARNHTILSYGEVNDKAAEMFAALQHSYGESLERMAAPWIMTVTNSLSIRRDLLGEVGLFDEGFKGAWLEDWELGYRLYQAGVTFKNAKDIACYHQAHPTNSTRRLENYLHFATKHPALEVLLLALMGPPFNLSLKEWGRAITQYRDLSQQAGTRYEELLRAFVELSETLYWVMGQLVSGKPPAFMDSVNAGFSRWPASIADKVRLELHVLRRETASSRAYTEFVSVFELLLLLPVKPGCRAPCTSR